MQRGGENGRKETMQAVSKGGENREVVVYRWCAQPEVGRADRGNRRKGDRNEETGIAGG